jgi:hypothetical protein
VYAAVSVFPLQVKRSGMTLKQNHYYGPTD